MCAAACHGLFPAAVANHQALAQTLELSEVHSEADFQFEYGTTK